MESVHFAPEIILAAATSEMNKAEIAMKELRRLMDIGYLNSQTGLDKAEEARQHLVKAYDLLGRVQFPAAALLRSTTGKVLAEHEQIIRRIKLTL
jgi:hypothetical protein